MTTATTRVCPFCENPKCPGRLGSPKYANQDFDRCQHYNRHRCFVEDCLTKLSVGSIRLVKGILAWRVSETNYVVGESISVTQASQPFNEAVLQIVDLIRY